MPVGAAMNSKHMSFALGAAFAALMSTSVAGASGSPPAQAGCAIDASAADVQYADASIAGGSGMMRPLSTRVERVGQNIAVTPLAAGMMVESPRRDAGSEPTLTTLLLAGLAVMAFVARRRRNG
jgi:hypothetical protein